MDVFSLLIGLAVGAAGAVFFLLRPQIRRADRQAASLQERNETLEARAAAAEATAARTQEVEEDAAKLRERNTALEARTATAEAAAARTTELEQRASKLREQNTGLQTRAAAAEAARLSETESQSARITDLTSRLATLQDEAPKLRADLSEARQRAGKAETALASERDTVSAHLEDLSTRLSALSDEAPKLRADLSEARQRAGKAESALASERNTLSARITDLTSRLGSVTAESRDLRQQLQETRQRAGKAESALASEQRSHEARLEEIRRFGEEIERKFGALSARALERSGQNFLQLVTERFEQHKEAAERDLGARQKEIRGLVRPLGDTLHDFRKTVDEIEKERAESQGKLEEQVRNLAQGQSQLNAETRSLVQALRKPQTRGRWGEVQLERVLEMAGMVRNQDFEQQPRVEGALRPDLILRLPGGRAIVVDAKTPLQGYLDAVEATTDAERQHADQAHARHVRSHVANLASKKYWDRIRESVDFVVMFLPGEAIFARAIETDPELLDYAVNHRILISTPTTFIALAKAIAYGWQQEKVAEESRKIAELGRVLFKRLTTFAGHLQKTGTSLRQTVENYNRSVGSFEARLLPKANQFDELHVLPAGSKIEAKGPVTTAVRSLSQPEPVAALPDGDRPPPRVSTPETASSRPAEASASSAAAPVGSPPVKASASPPPPPPTGASSGSRQRILDDMLRLLRQIEPDLELNPKKNYIGLLVGGRPRNFVRFKRRRDSILAAFSLPDGDGLREAFESEGLERRTDNRGQTLVPLTRATVANDSDFLLDLARRARDAHQGPGRRPRRRSGTRGRP